MVHANKGGAAGQPGVGGRDRWVRVVGAQRGEPVRTASSSTIYLRRFPESRGAGGLTGPASSRTVGPRISSLRGDIGAGPPVSRPAMRDLTERAPRLRAMEST